MTRTPDDDIAFIRALAQLLRETDLGEIEVSREYGE
ncbi:MAG: acetyl-CoA carboxylase, biotin carboxyl carrier protein, partial [Rubrimonas sp.]